MHSVNKLLCIVLENCGDKWLWMTFNMISARSRHPQQRRHALQWCWNKKRMCCSKDDVQCMVHCNVASKDDVQCMVHCDVASKEDVLCRTAMLLLCWMCPCYVLICGSREPMHCSDSIRPSLVCCSWRRREPTAGTVVFSALPWRSISPACVVVGGAENPLLARVVFSSVPVAIDKTSVCCSWRRREPTAGRVVFSAVPWR